MPHTGETKIIKEKIIRIENKAKREKYFNTFVEKLTTSLHLPEKRNGDE